MQKESQEETNRELSLLHSPVLSHNLMSLSPDSPSSPASFPHNLFQCSLCNPLYYKQTPTLRVGLLMSTILMTCSSVLSSVNLWVTLPHSSRTPAPGSLSFSSAQLLSTLSFMQRTVQHPNGPTVGFLCCASLFFFMLFFNSFYKEYHTQP